jgi:hypothetical protein
MESAVPEEMGETERKSFGVCEGELMGEPKEETEGAEGVEVDAGTEARYSAPPP